MATAGIPVSIDPLPAHPFLKVGKISSCALKPVQVLVPLINGFLELGFFHRLIRIFSSRLFRFSRTFLLRLHSRLLNVLSFAFFGLAFA